MLEVRIADLPLSGRGKFFGGLALCLALFGSGSIALADGEATLTTFDVPGSNGTRPMAINRGGAVTGYYVANGNTNLGFVRAADGTITTFEVSGSLQFVPIAINDKGTTTGWYYTNASIIHGFIRTADEEITTFDPPGSFRTLGCAIINKGGINV